MIKLNDYEIQIIIELSDQKGHSNRELSDLIGKDKGRMSDILGDMEDLRIVNRLARHTTNPKLKGKGYIDILITCV
jgi:DNA-binding MarR family transcriptional regulator